MIATFHAREANPDGTETIRVSLVTGSVYRFKGIEGKSGDKIGWVVPPGDYVLVGAGRHTGTNQELVAYRCVANGKLFFCTLSDWAAKFEVPKEEIIQSPIKAEVKEKVAGKGVGGMVHAPNPSTIHSVENEI